VGIVHAIVVYESLFGNTRQIGEAVAEGLRTARPDLEVRCLPVADAAAEGDLGQAILLVVGGPTHVLGMSSPRTRTSQGKDHQLAGPGVREWLAGLPAAARGARAAAFDTRLDKWFAGGAAPRIVRGLRRLGYHLTADPQAFFVEGMSGPLRAGERERARQWGSALTARIPTGSRL
jgi:hypothetical protein